MKAHDVELMVGIPKQTLLYYEKEGLITVARDDNNYRNYSQNNMVTNRIFVNYFIYCIIYFLFINI